MDLSSLKQHIPDLWTARGPQIIIYMLRGTPHPVIVNIRDTKDYVKVHSNYTTITGQGVLVLNYMKDLKPKPQTSMSLEIATIVEGTLNPKPLIPEP